MYDEHGDYIEPPRTGAAFWLKWAALAVGLIISAGEAFQRGHRVFGISMLLLVLLSFVGFYHHSKQAPEDGN